VIHSLRTSGDFRALRASGRRVSDGPITVIAAPPEQVGDTRVGYVIPRRVGTAVCRNRLRRQLREVLRQCDRQGTLPVSRYLVICNRDATQLEYSALTSGIERALRRVSSET
jgi:ribonuclease P protein component